MTGLDVIAIRAKFGIEREQFARILGVHPITVFRWENGLVKPSGPAKQVLEALDVCLFDCPETADDVIRFVLDATRHGGLEALICALFDVVAPNPGTEQKGNHDGK